MALHQVLCYGEGYDEPGFGAKKGAATGKKRERDPEKDAAALAAIADVDYAVSILTPAVCRPCCLWCCLPAESKVDVMELCFLLACASRSARMASMSYSRHAEGLGTAAVKVLLHRRNRG